MRLACSRLRDAPTKEEPGSTQSATWCDCNRSGYPALSGVTLREIGEYLDGSGAPLERVGRMQGKQAAVRRERLVRPRSERRGARGRLHTRLLQLLRARRGGHGDTQPLIPATIRDLTRAFEDIGADELVCWPTVAELNKVDWLAALVG
jgi:hypothetical protein